MNNQTMTLEEIRLAGIEVLSKHLGPIGMVRFLQQSETGWGNYTEERHKWLGDPDLKILAKEIQENTPPNNNKNITNHST